tara:strand:+ start:185 stop:793 length:609 start_codon:yes stop_codon:yes gene_type:complete
MASPIDQAFSILKFKTGRSDVDDDSGKWEQDLPKFRESMPDFPLQRFDTDDPNESNRQQADQEPLWPWQRTDTGDADAEQETDWLSPQNDLDLIAALHHQGDRGEEVDSLIEGWNKKHALDTGNLRIDGPEPLRVEDFKGGHLERRSGRRGERILPTRPSSGYHEAPGGDLRWGDKAIERIRAHQAASAAEAAGIPSHHTWG